MEILKTDLESNIPGGTLLRVREVCAELGVGKSFVYEAIACGKLGSVRIGEKAVRVPRKALVKFLNEALLAEQARR